LTGNAFKRGNGSFTPRSNPSPASCCPPNNPIPSNEQPNFDEEFDEAVAEWRDKHRLREDDAVMLLVELFRIHQRHWDEVRRRELPSFDQFRADIAKLVEAARTFQGQSAALLEIMRNQNPAHRAARITRAAAVCATIADLLAGYLIGRAWP
jgi:hypothetical protein